MDGQVGGDRDSLALSGFDLPDVPEFVAPSGRASETTKGHRPLVFIDEKVLVSTRGTGLKRYRHGHTSSLPSVVTQDHGHRFRIGYG